jgi:hypothetical protein
MARPGSFFGFFSRSRGVTNAPGGPSRWSIERGVLFSAALVTFGSGIGGGAAWLASRTDHAEAAKPRVVTKVEVVADPVATPAHPINVVFNVDITISVSSGFVRSSLRAFAASVPRLVHPDQGPVRIYLRLISPSPGDDSAAVARYTIPAVRKCDNAFDQRCRQARNVDINRAYTRARAIASAIRQLHFKRTSTRTIIRGAFAADADILASSNGTKWLVAATDLRPTGAPPEHPEIDLHGARVVILLACEQSIEKCQARKRIWRSELLDDGAASVTFLTAQQGDLLFTDDIGG